MLYFCELLVKLLAALILCFSSCWHRCHWATWIADAADKLNLRVNETVHVPMYLVNCTNI